MKKILTYIMALGLFASFAAVGAVAAEPQGPETSDIWICPSVSTDNPNGMWVIGGHGAYYIIKPGTSSPNWPMILNPTGNLEEHASHVEHKAQHAAYKGLYRDLTYLDTGDGIAVVLDDGVEFLYEHFGITIDPMTMVHVVPSDDAWYDETAMTLYANLPLKTAVFW